MALSDMSGRLLRVQVLGGFQLLWGDVPLPPLATRQARSLFTYLVLSPKSRHTREKLAGTFWPDLDESRGRRRLSQALWQIQSALAEMAPSEKFFETDSDTVRMRSGLNVVVDAHEFDRLHGAGTNSQTPQLEAEEMLAKAVNLYHGDLMAGTYDDWVFVEQSRLREAYLDCLGRLSRLHRSRGDYKTALSLAVRVVIHEPLREAAHQEVMRLQSLLGRFSEAFEQYETCRRILDDELGVRPCEATESLHREIVERARDPLSNPQPRAEPLLYGHDDDPMVGRFAERAEVLDVFDGALAGTGRTVLLEGPAGIGKSRMLRELSSDAHWRGLSVMSVRWQEGSFEGPWGNVVKALQQLLTPARWAHLTTTLADPWIQELERLMPGLCSDGRLVAFQGTAEDRSESIREAIAQAIVGSAIVQPLVLVLDDIHWADSENWHLLALLTARATTVPLVVLASYRGLEARASEALWDHLQRIDRASRPTRLELAPLSESESAELVRRCFRLQTLSNGITERVVHETAGNPLFLLETLRELADRPAAAESEVVPKNMLPVSASIEEAVLRRLDFLTSKQREAAGAAAVIGDGATLYQIAATTGRPLGDIASDVLALLAKGFMSDQNGTHEFRHGQVRTIIERSLPATSRVRFHNAFALWLDANSAGSFARRGFHHLGAGQTVVASQCFEAAGDEAVTLGAYDAALTHFLNALDAGSSSAHIHPDLLLKTESTAEVVGDRSAQRMALDTLRNEPTLSPEVSVEEVSRRAVLLAQEGQPEEAGREATRAVRGARMLPNSERALAVANRALGLVAQLGGDHVRAIAALQSSITADMSDGEAAKLTLQVAQSLRALGRYDECWRFLEEASLMLNKVNDSRGATDVLGIRGAVLMEQGLLSDAYQVQRETVERAEEIVYRRGEAVATLNLGNIEVSLGRIAPALAAFTRAATIFGEIVDPAGVARSRANAATVHSSYLGDWEAADSLIAEATSYFASVQDSGGMAQCFGVRVTSELVRGRVPMALNLASECLALATQTERPWAIARAQLLMNRAKLVEGKVGEVLEAELARPRDLGTHDLLLSEALIAKEDGAAASELLDSIDSSRLSLLDRILHVSLLGRAARLEGDATAAREQSALANDLLHELLGTADSESQERARQAVPLFADIHDQYAALHPIRHSLTVARLGAPLGRPLTESDTEKLDVVLSLPADIDIEGTSDRRRHRIARILAQLEKAGLVVTLPQLATVLSVSVSTIRRDIDVLRASGMDVVTRGHNASSNA